MYPPNFNNVCNDTLDGIYSTIVDDGDVINSSYKVDPNAKNYLRIDAYDMQTGKLSGSFGGTYVLYSRGTNDSTAVDTIKVTNGKFTTQILN